MEFPGSRIEFIKGSGGIFDVRLEGDLIFSKHQVGRFPEPGEVIENARQHLNG